MDKNPLQRALRQLYHHWQYVTPTKFLRILCNTLQLMAEIKKLWSKIYVRNGFSANGDCDKGIAAKDPFGQELFWCLDIACAKMASAIVSVPAMWCRYWISALAFLFERNLHWPGWIFSAGSGNLCSFRGRYWISISGLYRRYGVDCRDPVCCHRLRFPHVPCIPTWLRLFFESQKTSQGISAVRSRFGHSSSQNASQPHPYHYRKKNRLPELVGTTSSYSMQLALQWNPQKIAVYSFDRLNESQTSTANHCRETVHLGTVMLICN